jgi:hypothetical protein
MRLLPRYTFRAGELCPHGDPDCLCDVTVTQTTRIVKNIPHMFHNLALEELGDYGVTSRNVVEFFSIVLGCHETFRREVAENEDADNLWSNVPQTGKEGAGPAVWQALPCDMRTVLRRHAVAGTPWSYAALEVDDTLLDSEDGKVLRKYYNDCRRNAYHSDRRRSVVVLGGCVHCGAPFKARGTKRIFCSTQCKAYSHRDKAKGQS